MKPTHYTPYLGADWQAWPGKFIEPSAYGQRDEYATTIAGKPVYSLGWLRLITPEYPEQFPYELIARWDCVNGWTKPLP